MNQEMNVAVANHRPTFGTQGKSHKNTYKSTIDIYIASNDANIDPDK